ncbi:phage tail protein, partial [Salmonella enterica subsp. enterica serovar Typhimurium]|nr:phage tail protein [Salmonella enterica subsp. enterica serovar Typhimurium]EBY6861545.1 phage tail protein [Salmonella enterica subsp. enterica serovar Typhimurium]EBY7555036.1 phage tail protein [Salmonella enterica subsp. enterica serovar Typhimurium]ECA5884256.1 phage tail protein [Salmonella enterica subsp. enterica serovar Typhimurium]
MHRIDTKTAQKDKFGAGKNGFTRGNHQTGTPATDLDDDYFDMLQEELCSVVEASGASLEKGRHDQLLTALRALLLSRKNPFGDIKSDGTVKTALENLGLEETINRAADALQKSQNGADIPDKPRFVQNIGLKETLNPTKRVSIGNIGTGVFDGSTPCINIGDSDSGFIGSADGVLDIYCNAAKVGYIDGNGLHMLTDIHFDNARMTTNGDIFGSVWGNNWLSIWITNQLNTRGTIDWINSELAVRDNNINTRATWDYVNQTFARKNTGSIQDWGWILDDSTGFIMQWGTLGNSNGTYNFPRAFPVGCFAVFVTNTNAQ